MFFAPGFVEKNELQMEAEIPELADTYNKSTGRVCEMKGVFFSYVVFSFFSEIFFIRWPNC